MAPPRKLRAGLTGLWLLFAVSLAAQAPPVFAPFAGDPRLEPIPASPVALADFPGFLGTVPVGLRFPPRVNGQTKSDGDGHSELFVFFRAADGTPVAQLPLADAAPKGASATVDDRRARLFSPIWRLNAVMTDASYNPADLGQRIDSFAELASSPHVQAIYRTNIFFNGPVLPNGSSSGAGALTPRQAYFEGDIVTLARFDVSDGPFPIQTIYRVEDQAGTVLGPPWLLLSRVPAQPFYSPILDVWSIRVPNGAAASSIKSLADAQAASAQIVSAGMRINAPATSVNGAARAWEDPFALLTSAGGVFDPGKFPFTLPQNAWNRERTFVIAAVEQAANLAPPPLSDFPAIDPDGKGNVVPLILQDPFQQLSSGPNSKGPIVRISQADLDAAFQNQPPRLPASIEANFSALVNAGLLAPEWLPGGRPFQDRLAAVGRALFELSWSPEQGANVKDVTACVTCHTQPVTGGAARSAFTLITPSGVKSNAGSIWGAGSAQLLVALKTLAGEQGLTSPHGALGLTPTVRAVVNTASNKHYGIQTAEFVAQQLGNPAGFDATTDLDGDGVANEESVGEVTAQTAYMLSLPIPNPASAEALAVLGIDAFSVSAGRSLFRRPISDAGAGCASCHRSFHRMASDTLALSNPQTAGVIPLTVQRHQADADEVAEGWADFVGQPGLRVWGDYRWHKMGSLMAQGSNDVFKTAELWDAGSVAPYGATGGFGSDLGAVIAAHAGVPLSALAEVQREQLNFPVGPDQYSAVFLTLSNTSQSSLPATPAAPIRVVLTGDLPPGVTSVNAASPGPAGDRRQGSAWLITDAIPPGGVRVVTMGFRNPAAASLQFQVIAESHAGFSEAAASAAAFASLSAQQRQDVINFLSAQLIGDTSGEGAP